ncbi:MAG: ABC transporter ATP-binding protein [Chloroflexota bacterium]
MGPLAASSSWFLGPFERSPRFELLRTLIVVKRSLAIVAGLLTLLAALLPSAVALLSGTLIGLLIQQANRGSSIQPGLVAAISGLGALFIVQQLAATLRAGVAESLASRCRTAFRLRLMQAVSAPRTIAHLEDPRLLDQINQAKSTGWGDPERAARAFMSQQTTRLQAIAALVLVGQFQWWLAPILFACFVFRQALLARAQQQYVEINSGQARLLRSSAYLRDLGLRAPAAKEARVFGLGQWLVDRFEQKWLDGMRELWRHRPRLLARLTFAALPLVIAEIGSVFLVGSALASHRIGPAELMVYAQALVITFRTLGCFSQEDNTIDQGTVGLIPLRDLERTLTSDGRFRMSGNKPATGLPTEDVRFEHVSFRYPDQEREVLSDLNLVLRAGTSTALVGDNGAGKTTIVKLLARLYDPDAGRITADGTPLTELDARTWQRQVAALFQDFQRFGLTAADNVGFGDLERIEDTAALTRAAQDAQVSELIEQLPQGWQTMLSRQYTGGADVSGGEWQRIALARALLAARRPGGILVLDEPTAHLDVRGEAAFYDRFLDLTRGQTTVIISHRFSTVRRADNIVVLQSGRIVEEGNHEQLMALGGRYAALFRLQAQRFEDTSDEQADDHPASMNSAGTPA